jgi:hypothetical protein
MIGKGGKLVAIFGRTGNLHNPRPVANNRNSRVIPLWFQEPEDPVCNHKNRNRCVDRAVP